MTPSKQLIKSLNYYKIISYKNIWEIIANYEFLLRLKDVENMMLVNN